jgi:hypothetical protein
MGSRLAAAFAASRNVHFPLVLYVLMYVQFLDRS